jgi:hypothetical protein
MKVRTTAAAAMAALCLAAACRDEGGELRDATARRRAELANRDTSKDHAAAPADTSTRLPAFLADTPTRAPVAPAKPPADTAAKDTAMAAAPANAWTTGVRQGGRATTLVTLRGLRASSNAVDGYDRIVLDFGTQAVPRWRVSYADSPPSRCGSGQATTVPGQAWLVIHLRTTQAHDDAGQPTIRQRQASLNMPVMRQMEITCDFEGETEIVVGVSAANPYRVLELTNPSRVAVDVRHQP